MLWLESLIEENNIITTYNHGLTLFAASMAAAVIESLVFPEELVEGREAERHSLAFSPLFCPI